MFEKEPFYRRQQVDKQWDSMIMRTLEKIRTHYYPGCVVEGNPLQYNADFSSTAWMIVEKVYNPKTGFEDYKTTWVEIEVKYNKDETPVSFIINRNGIVGEQICDLFENTLLQRLIEIEESVKRERDVAQKEELIMEWERKPWWEKIWTPRPE